MQALLFEKPQVLPVAEFDESFFPAIPIGREVETPAGYIDLLLVSPHGKLIIVETKLWKNPEKHRTVVAQIIDYAKELSRWSYDDFETKVNKSLRSNPGETSTFAALVEAPLLEAGVKFESFQEQLISSLLAGEFLLLIVGDRISPNLALLSSSISGVPGLNFRLGLVELHLHRVEEGSEWPLLVIPDVVGKTVEKVRGVVQIQYKGERPKVEIAVEDDDKSSPRGKTNRMLFLNQVRLDLRPVFEKWLDAWEGIGWSMNWGVKGFSLRIKIGEDTQSVMYAFPDWAISIIREDDMDLYGMGIERFQSYREKISHISAANRILENRKRYVNLEDVSGESLDTLFQAMTDLFNSSAQSED
ncbi:hypothetical protein KQI65_09800 [bacterium]|nr:hypothetical protein [bacterium]